MQDQAGAVGLREVRYETGANHVAQAGNPLFLPKDLSNPYFDFDPSKCIVCSRCVRACDEVQGTFALTIEGRGFESRVSPGHAGELPRLGMRLLRRLRPGLPDGDADREDVVEKGTPDHSVVTTCAYCGVGCTFQAEMRGEELVRMVPWKDGKANRGHTCVKGRFAWGYANHNERILKPMIRETITDHLARSDLGRGASPTPRAKFRRHPGPLWPRRDRRHHLVALHQ